MFLLLYGGNANPKLPNFVDKLFNYAVFRIFILSIIVYKGNSNALHCILISILFVYFTMLSDITSNYIIEGWAIHFIYCKQNILYMLFKDSFIEL